MAGAKVSLFDLIDELDGAVTMPDLVARLKPILNRLAYSAEMGEGAVLEAHEQWRTEYAEHLYAETESDHQRDRAAAYPEPDLDFRRGGASSRAPEAQRRGEKQTRRGQQAPPAARPRANAPLPPSLQAIFNGSHSSLHQDD
jgi:hypothetical protein